MQSSPEAPRPSTGTRRPRRVSRTRQTFLAAINAQITGTRVLAVVVLVVCLAGGVYWLVGTTGSPVIGVAFIALALMLSITVTAFIQVMYLFTGKR
jgi:hypothetical protein